LPLYTYHQPPILLIINILPLGIEYHTAKTK
jgi:hypothetical protein